jgi:hypothetical protein
MSMSLKDLFGLHPSAQPLQDYISSLASLTNIASARESEVKSYPDAVYFNYYTLGCSFVFKPINGYKPSTNLQRQDLKNDSLILDGIDVYNSTSTTQTKSKLTPEYSTYPQSPLLLTLNGKTGDGKDRPESMSITPTTSGKEFVECIGEPDRKGGGAGPSTGSISIWCEWSKDGIMVEFGGDDARGPQAWEKGKDARWKVITIYQPNKW